MNPQSFNRAHLISAKFRAANPQEHAGIRAAVKDDRGELLIYEDIGLDWWTGGGITAKSVMDQLATLKGVKGLDVRFNCFGGDVFEGKAIYEAIKRFDCADKVAHIDSIAASAASMIMMACDKIVMSPAATVMIHRAWSFAMGNCIDMRSTADILDLEDGNIAGIYQAKTGKPKPDCLDLMTAETWMNAEQALEMGFVDEIARKSTEAEDDKPAEPGNSVPNAARLAAITRERIASANRERLSAKIQQHPRASPGAAPVGQPARTK